MNVSIPKNTMPENSFPHHQCIGSDIEIRVLIPAAEINPPVENNAPIANSANEIDTPVEHIFPANSIPYECPILGCSTVFQLKYSVNRHIQQFHGELRPDTGTYGIKKYVCEFICGQKQCGRRCLSKNNIKQHFQQQHGKDLKYKIDWDDVEPLQFK